MQSRFNFTGPGLILILSSIAYLSLPGCEKPVHRFDYKPLEKCLVINGSLGPDQPLMMHVSSSMAPAGKDIVENITNAEISITDELGSTIYSLNDSMGFYMAAWYPEEGRTYRIEVKAPGFEEARVSVRIPATLTGVFLSVDSSMPDYPFVLKIIDKQEDENTYMVRTWFQYKEIKHLWSEPGGWFTDTIDERRLVTMRSKDELITYSADGNIIGDSEFGEGERSSTGFLISDELFNGKEHILRFRPSYIRNVDPDKPYMYVEVLLLSRDFYSFVRSYTLHYKAHQDPFAEPVAILTNIENGLGFVYGYSIHTDSVRID